MQIFYFRSETHQCLISAVSRISALERFTSAIRDIYGHTLKGIEIDSDCAITIHWQEEDTDTMIKDLFELRVLKENDILWISADSEELSMLMPSQSELNAPGKSTSLNRKPRLIGGRC